jgi:ribonuclease VapC
MFIETSAVVEYLNDGPKAAEVLAKLEAANTPLSVSPITIFEATSVLASRRQASVDDARSIVSRFVGFVGATNMTITPEIGEIAISAMARYGKGRGHPAQLNFGDCFSYACAKAAGVPLLYVGSDFLHTDIA